MSLADHRPKHVSTKKPFRLWGIAIAVAFQALLIWALVVGLGQATIDLLRDNLVAVALQEDVSTDDAPPPPPPDFKPPPAVVAAPEVNIDLSEAPAPTTTAIQSVTTERPPVVNTAPIITVKLTRATQNLIANMKQFYPDLSRRLDEEGTVILLVTISEEGKVTDAAVKKSSGFPRLDEAAVTVVKARFNFIPAMQGGKPISQSVDLPIKWQIRTL